MPPLFGRRLSGHRWSGDRASWRGPAGWSVLLSALVLLVGCTTAPDGTSPSSAVPTATDRSDATTGVDAPTGTGRQPSAPNTDPVTTTAVTTAVAVPPSTRPAIPGVVGLRWLGPDPHPTGPQITLADGSERWQSAVSGEYAVRGPGGRRWFGADGSAVACRGVRTCVGFDADGNIAVVDGTSVRSVYGPSGAALGLYTADGRRRAGAAQPSFAEAVAGTGLDLGALVDEAGRRVPFAGGVTGDPHLITGGGRRVSVQFAGDFEARNGDPQRRIQVRWREVPHQPDVTITTAVAIATGGTIVQIDGDGEVLIGGATIEDRDQFRQIGITGGPVVGAWPIAQDASSSVALIWADGAALTVQTDPALGITAVLTAPRSSSVRGVFGTGDPTSTDLVDRQGIALDSRSVLADWSVPPGDTLFDVAGPSSVGYPTAVPDVPTEAVAFATRSCRSRGVATTPDLAACIFDVALTGDARFAEGHGRLVAAARTEVPTALTRRWPAMLDEAPASASLLPALVDIEPAQGQQLAYNVPVAGNGTLTFRFVSGCPQDSGLLTVDRPAVRLFDPSGHAVSARIPVCGQFVTDRLAPGRYRLVVAGPLVGDPMTVRFELTEG